MGNGSELYRNHVEGYKRRIENRKKDIARYRDILKNNPGFTASQKNSYKLTIEGWQKEIKMLQNVLAAAKENLARTIKSEQEAKKREQEKIKRAKEKAREELKREKEEAKKAAAASRASASLSISSSTSSSVKSSVVSASIAASWPKSSSSNSKPSTTTYSEPSTPRVESLSSYSSKSNETPSSKSKGYSKKSLVFCILPALVGVYLLYLWYESYIQWWDTIWQILCYIFAFPPIVCLFFFPLIMWLTTNDKGKD